MKVWSICVASISVTITDFLTKFGTEHKYHTVNMPEWPSLHKLVVMLCLYTVHCVCLFKLFVCIFNFLLPLVVNKDVHKLKIHDGGGRHLEFRKNVHNFALDKDILHQIIWEDAPKPCRDDHVTRSWNRKLTRVTSSNEGLKHMCVDLSDYNTYLNQIWYRTQTLHYQHACMAKFT